MFTQKSIQFGTCSDTPIVYMLQCLLPTFCQFKLRITTIFCLDCVLQFLILSLLLIYINDVLVVVLLTFNHVLYMWTDCPHGGKLLFGSEPFLNLQETRVYHANVNSQVFEVPFENSAGPFNCHQTRFHMDRKPVWDFDFLICYNLLHVWA